MTRIAGNMRRLISEVGFYLGVAFTLGSALTFGFRQQPTEMGLGIFAGGLVMTFFRLEYIQSFRGMGFQLETVRSQIDEATATLEQLKVLAITLGKPMLGLLASAGGFGGEAATTETFTELTMRLKKMGMSDEQVAEATSIYYAYRTVEHWFHIERRLPRSLVGTEPVRLEGLYRYEDLWIAPPADFRRELKAMDLLDDETEEAVKDYEFFLKHRTLRRPDLWQKVRLITP